MPKVILTGRIIVPDGDLDGVVDALSAHIDLSRQEKGCLKFEVTQSAEHKNIFTVYEEFVDKAAFQRHQERVRDSVWGRISANAERHYEMGERS
ncbi:MAG TPA: antibiotic biosynthesis monooxygenase [Alcanivorax sp.]|jgi:quinol monooxygenase YgiN|nr:antibiotic biosynthesis monooxygenase [Alcanivorax sp.]